MKAAKLFGFKQGYKMNVQEKLNFELKVADVEKEACKSGCKGGLRDKKF